MKKEEKFIPRIPTASSEGVACGIILAMILGVPCWMVGETLIEDQRMKKERPVITNPAINEVASADARQ